VQDTLHLRHMMNIRARMKMQDLDAEFAVYQQIA